MAVHRPHSTAPAHAGAVRRDSGPRHDTPAAHMAEETASTTDPVVPMTTEAARTTVTTVPGTEETPVGRARRGIDNRHARRHGERREPTRHVPGPCPTGTVHTPSNVNAP